MASQIVNIKTDQKVKKQAQKIAADLGLSLSGVINAYLRQFIRTKTIYLSLTEENPSQYLMAALEESEQERREKNIHSFSDSKKAIEFLDKQ